MKEGGEEHGAIHIFLVGLAVGRYPPNADKYDELLDQLKELKSTEEIV